MRYQGAHNWPPVWVAGLHGGLDRKGPSIRGEIGILRYVTMIEQAPPRCFLVMEHDSRTYTGALLFDDALFCLQIARLLESLISSSMKEIGDIDVGFTL